MKFIKETTNEIVVGISYRQWIDDWYDSCGFDLIMYMHRYSEIASKTF